ncbi:protein trichome birefringence-like 23 isoform X2 [Coffea arabica]|uniref:Protein trichome birefringence-like 23 isoform X2 n=1 Tax=Coffea arabica TaxID=13443 RepID=A0ABM4VJE6_COFAR
MMKKISFNWTSWWWSLHKQNYLVLKLGVSILLIGLVFRLLYPLSGGVSEVQDIPIQQTVSPSTPPPLVSVSSPLNSNQHSPNGTETSDRSSDSSGFNEADNESQENDAGRCDLFVGDWIPHPGGPVYTNETCDWIEGHQNCMKNGRPDTGYLYWRWSPRECELPQLNPNRFLELMRNKALALIGDSISRNHIQSLICVLSKAEKAVQVYHDEDYKSRRWLFPSHNFTVSVLWSPFLAQAAIFEDYNGVSTSEIELHLDKLDGTWTEQFKSLDYIMFSSGEWYAKSAIYYKNNTVLGCHYCPKRNLTERGFDFAYREVLRNFFDYITESNHKGMIFFRTSTPEHFENGEWFSGGTCNRTEPVKEGEFLRNELNRILRDIEIEEFRNASTKASEKGVNLKLFDVNPLSLLRPDGHPGPYRFFQPFAKDKNAKIIKDCLHWCLPGPIDTWNDLLMKMVVNG